MTEPVEHLDLDTLAELAGGLLDADRVVAARGHLAGCARCQDDAAALQSVSADLAALGADDAPMPAEVAARVDAALAEAGDPRRTSSVTVVPSLDDRRVRSPRGTQLLQVAAVLVVLLALVGVGYTLTTGGGDAGDTTSAGSAADSAGGSSAESAPRVVASGTDYQQDSLGQALGALAGPPAGRGARSPGLKADSSTAPPSRQGALSASPGATDDSSGGAAAGDGAAALASPDALGACLDKLGLVGAPLGVDLASFDGKPAAVVVLPSEGDPTHVDVYAIAPACPAGDFLGFARVVKP